jgi:hypothetical protein
MVKVKRHQPRKEWRWLHATAAVTSAITPGCARSGMMGYPQRISSLP